MESKNPKKKGINPKSLANLKPPFQPNNTISVGYGRPRIPNEERAVRESNYQLLNAIVQTGVYREIMMEVIEKQTARGQIDAIKWMFENAVGSTVLPPSASEMMDQLGLS